MESFKLGSWLLLAAGGACLASPVSAAEPISWVVEDAVDGVRDAGSNFMDALRGDGIQGASASYADPTAPCGPSCSTGYDSSYGSCCRKGPLRYLDPFRPMGDPFTVNKLIWGCCENPPFTVGGWVQTGMFNKSDGVFNTYDGKYQLQQANLYIEKVANGSEGWGFGGRADLMYGTDAQNTQAFGNVNPGHYDYLNGWDHGVYGFALPQLYAEAAYGDLSVKAGHFYTILGYQVVPATGNFFYSIPFTFNFAEAFTHTGALATYKASDKVTVYGGYTLGWDTGFYQYSQGSSFLGGTSVKPTDDLTVTYILTAGNLGFNGQGYTHSVVADWVISDKWEYVFQSDLDNTSKNVYFSPGGHYETIGLNQYLYYKISDRLKAGGRAEWWKGDGTSYYEITGGFNYFVTANTRIRPEVRHQWGGTDGNVFGIPVNQTIIALDAVTTF